MPQCKALIYFRCHFNFSTSNNELPSLNHLSSDWLRVSITASYLSAVHSYYMQEPSYTELKIICLDLNRRLRFLEEQVQELQSQLTQHIQDSSRLYERTSNATSLIDRIEAINVENPVRYTKEQILSFRPRGGSETTGNGEMTSEPHDSLGPLPEI